MTELKNHKILLIEDDALAAELVCRQLRSAAARSHNASFDVTCATYVRDGIEQLASGDFDVVLLDLSLPDSRGLDAIERLKAQDEDASIIIVTNSENSSIAVQAAHEGAHSFLNKSQLQPDFLVRSLLYATESRRRRRVERRLTASDREIQAAGALQRMLLPTSAPFVPGLDIAGGYWPFDQVGGDYFDYFLRDGRLSLVIADVSGHGLASAMVMAGLRRIVRSCAAIHDDVGTILSIANRAVCEDTGDAQFVTAFFGSVDIGTREITYASAGHPSYIARKSGEVTHLDQGDIPLGLNQDAALSTSPSVPLQPGDVLVLLTDGFFEVCNSKDEIFGIDAVMSQVDLHRQKSAEEIIAACYGAARAHCAPKPVGDDMAMIVVKIAES